jgi:hypothetical protein
MLAGRREPHLGPHLPAEAAGNEAVTSLLQGVRGP